MSTRVYTMPKTSLVGRVGQNGVQLERAWANYFRGIEDLSKREVVGTWTPVMEGGTVAGTHTYSQQIGHYVRQGRVCHFWGRCAISALDATATGNFHVGGLPFTSIDEDVDFSPCVAAQIARVDLSAGKSQFVANVKKNATAVAIVEVGDDVGAADVSITALQNNALIMVGGSYLIVG